MQCNARLAATIAAAIALGVSTMPAVHGQSDRFSQFWGSQYRPQPSSPRSQQQTLRTTQDVAQADRLHHWNEVALSASALDHSPVLPGETRTFGEQVGPGRTARALALVHVAIFDAVNSIAHRYHGFTRIPDVPATASIDAAIAQAAHDTLVALYPSQAAHCDQVLAEDLASMPQGAERALGIEAGRRAARTLMALVANDGSNQPDPIVGVDYFPADAPGEWQPDPVSGVRVALGASWGQVRPLVIESAAAHRVPPPPALASKEYAEAFREVKALGGDADTTPTIRSNDQTMAGIFWAYDGTPKMGPPPRVFNQIAMSIADQMGTDTVDLARLLALVNVAMADSGIASWESKYHWRFWRPVTAVRDAARDGNDATEPDPAFTPLGAQASNMTGPNFTPPFPAYPSGHATFGGAVFQILRHFYGTDNIAFTFVSDELNGETLDNHGIPRPLFPRTFANLSQAEEENGQSRIYLGIHWAFDKTAGIAQGRSIADEIYRKAALPR